MTKSSKHSQASGKSKHSHGSAAGGDEHDMRPSQVRSPSIETANVRSSGVPHNMMAPSPVNIEKIQRKSKDSLGGESFSRLDGNDGNSHASRGSHGSQSPITNLHKKQQKIFEETGEVPDAGRGSRNASGGKRSGSSSPVAPSANARNSSSLSVDVEHKNTDISQQTIVVTPHKRQSDDPDAETPPWRKSGSKTSLVDGFGSPSSRSPSNSPGRNSGTANRPSNASRPASSGSKGMRPSNVSVGAGGGPQDASGTTSAEIDTAAPPVVPWRTSSSGSIGVRNQYKSVGSESAASAVSGASEHLGPLPGETFVQGLPPWRHSRGGDRPSYSSESSGGSFFRSNPSSNVPDLPMDPPWKKDFDIRDSDATEDGRNTEILRATAVVNKPSIYGAFSRATDNNNTAGGSLFDPKGKGKKNKGTGSLSSTYDVFSRGTNFAQFNSPEAAARHERFTDNFGRATTKDGPQVNAGKGGKDSTSSQYPAGTAPFSKANNHANRGTDSAATGSSGTRPTNNTNNTSVYSAFSKNAPSVNIEAPRSAGQLSVGSNASAAQRSAGQLSVASTASGHQPRPPSGPYGAFNSPRNNVSSATNASSATAGSHKSGSPLFELMEEERREMASGSPPPPGLTSPVSLGPGLSLEPSSLSSSSKKLTGSSVGSKPSHGSFGSKPSHLSQGTKASTLSSGSKTPSLYDAFNGSSSTRGDTTVSSNASGAKSTLGNMGNFAESRFMSRTTYGQSQDPNKTFGRMTEQDKKNPYALANDSTKNSVLKQANSNPYSLVNESSVVASGNTHDSYFGSPPPFAPPGFDRAGGIVVIEEDSILDVEKSGTANNNKLSQKVSMAGHRQTTPSMASTAASRQLTGTDRSTNTTQSSVYSAFNRSTTTTNSSGTAPSSSSSGGVRDSNATTRTNYSAFSGPGSLNPPQMMSKTDRLTSSAQRATERATAGGAWNRATEQMRWVPGEQPWAEGDVDTYRANMSIADRGWESGGEGYPGGYVDARGYQSNYSTSSKGGRSNMSGWSSSSSGSKMSNMSTVGPLMSAKGGKGYNRGKGSTQSGGGSNSIYGAFSGGRTTAQVGDVTSPYLQEWASKQGAGGNAGKASESLMNAFNANAEFTPGMNASASEFVAYKGAYDEQAMMYAQQQGEQMMMMQAAAAAEYQAQAEYAAMAEYQAAAAASGMMVYDPSASYDDGMKHEYSPEMAQIMEYPNTAGSLDNYSIDTGETSPPTGASKKKSSVRTSEVMDV